MTARGALRVLALLSGLLGGLGLAALGSVAALVPGEIGWADGLLGAALSAATLAAGVGLWRGARWAGPLALAVWGAQVVTVAVGAWAWRWTLGPYVHLRLGPGGARGTAYGLGLHADVRPMDCGFTDYVAVNIVAVVVVAALAAALHRARRSTPSL